MAASVTRIDDQDSSVVYSRPVLGHHWAPYGGPDEYLSTTSLTRTKGANAKITFSGSSIAVYGTVSAMDIDTKGTTSQYIIDTSPPVSYVSKPTKDTQHSVKFFQSAQLTPGEHTLEVINESEGGWLWLDFFAVTGAASASSAVSASSQAPNSTTALSSTTSVLSSTTSSTSLSGAPATSSTSILTTSMNSSQQYTFTATVSAPSTTAFSVDSAALRNTKGPSAGAIVGGVFGGIIGLIIIIAMIWCIRRKLADNFADEAAAIPTNAPVIVPSNAHNTTGSAVTPFDLSGKRSMTLAHDPFSANVTSAYLFGPGGAAQQPYYQSPAPRKMQAGTQQRSHNTNSMALPSHSVAPSDGFMCTDPTTRTSTCVTGMTGINRSTLVSEQAGYGFTMAEQPANSTAPESSFDVPPPAYPGLPPGIPVGATESRGKQ